MEEALVQINGITKKFQGMNIPALNNISTSIYPGYITGLVGPDGAGKTTLIRLMTGLLLPNEGRIFIASYDTKKDVNQIYHLIGYMPQKFGLYEDLTVIENLRLYADLKNIVGKEREKKFEKLLNFTDLATFQTRLAGKLSGGMKQKLGLACTLLGEPKLLLLDEPSVGVDPVSRRELWKMVKELINNGLAVVWSTAYLDEAERCDNVILLNEGIKLYEGSPIDLINRVIGRTFQAEEKDEHQRRLNLIHLLNQKEIIDGGIHGKYLQIVLKQGANLSSVTDLDWHEVKPNFEDAFVDILGGGPGGYSALVERMASKADYKEAVIVAENLTKRFGDFIAVNNISFNVKQGEIFGLLGPNGAGKSTTFKMMCGLLQATSGIASIKGLDFKTASSQARNRVGYMAQKFSLYGHLNIKQNLTLFSGLYGLTGKEQREKIDMMIEVFDFQDHLKQNAEALPLGFKQRLALACAVMHEPDVLFLDEPTSGVDPITRREFWIHINGMVEKGVTVMVTTHFMDEAEYCDRIGLVYRGKNIATGTPDSLKNLVVSEKIPTPSLEDAFIELVLRHDLQQQEEQVSC